VRTDAEDKYAYKWVPTNASSNVWIYELMASWEGDDLALGADSSVITLTFMPVATSISIATSSSSTILGYAINASGRLVDEYGDPLRNEEVFLSCGNLEGVSTVSRMTDESGCFLVTWIPIRPGSFMVKAEWMGNTTFDSSNINATVCSIAYGQHIFSVESNSSTSQLSFNETDQSLRFTASGPDGTNGYARVTVAKEFITDPLMVRVSIDDANEDFSVLSTDDSWILAFDYSHSAHFVVVDLDIMAVPEFQQFMVLPLFLTGSLLATLLSRRRRD
jgi:hypothetical protein